MTDETTTNDGEALDGPEPRLLPDDETLRPLAEAFESAEFSVVTSLTAPDQDVVRVGADDYHGFVTAARVAGFDYFIDLCGVDYLRRRPRFDVVVNVLSHVPARRLRIIAATDASLPTISDQFAGANFYERETFDLFGISFDGHHLIDALHQGVVVEHAAGGGTGAHGDHPLGVGHLVVDLAQHRRHLLRHPARHDHEVGLPW